VSPCAKAQGFLFAGDADGLGIHVQTAVAQNGAFSIAPYNLVTDKTADPDKETDYILNRQQPPLLLRDRIMDNGTGSGKRRATAQNQSKEEEGPRAGIRSPKQER